MGTASRGSDNGHQKLIMVPFGSYSTKDNDLGVQ